MTDDHSRVSAAPPSAPSETPLPSRPWAPEEALGVLALAALVGITLINVLVRYLTDRSFAWTEEISVFLLVALTLAGAAAAAIRDAHIRIEFFYTRGSVRRRRALMWLSVAASALMFILLSVLIGRSALGEFQYGETTMGLGVPRWWYSVWLPPLALLVGVRALQNGWRQRVRREAKDEGAAS